MYLFDLDGTLIDSGGVWNQIDIDFLERRNLPLTPEYEAGVKYANFYNAAIFTKKYGNLSESPEEIMAEWMNMAREAYAHSIPLKPFVREFLDQCKAEGETLAIYTSSEPELCFGALEHYGLREYFTDVIFTRELGAEKHTPEAYRAVLKRLGITAGECRFFDDSPLACAGAMEAGWDVTGVYDKSISGEWSSFLHCAHRCIHTFGELLKTDEKTTVK